MDAQHVSLALRSMGTTRAAHVLPVRRRGPAQSRRETSGTWPLDSEDEKAVLEEVEALDLVESEPRRM